MGVAIGIDLGTTNSGAAIVEAGRPRMIPLSGSNPMIPSVLAIDDKGRQLVGNEAKAQAVMNPQNTVVGAKRLIGRSFQSPTIERVRQLFNYEVLQGADDGVAIKVRDRLMTPEEVSAAILTKVKTACAEHLRVPVTMAVITVPAYFNDRQRDAVRAAGKLAGLNVLRILNEPTAAALAYGMGKRLQKRIAVYDLGGGTFDVSVIDIHDNVFEVLGTGGDTFLGGVDFDTRLVTLVLETCHNVHGVDLSWHRTAMQRIRDAAEAAKIELSTVTATRVLIQHLSGWEGRPFDLDLEVTRSQLEQLTADLVNRTLATCRRILHDAGSQSSEIGDLLLVGGQSRMPLVQRLVGDFLGRQPNKGVHPDQAVALGAAIMAHTLSSIGAADLVLLDVLPMSIGIGNADGSMRVLFKRNQPLPDFQKITLLVKPLAGRGLELPVYQGDSMRVAENEVLGTLRAPDLLTAGLEIPVDVTFHLSTEGTLTVTAKVQSTGRELNASFRVSVGGVRA